MLPVFHLLGEDFISHSARGWDWVRSGVEFYTAIFKGEAEESVAEDVGEGEDVFASIYIH